MFKLIYASTRCLQEQAVEHHPVEEEAQAVDLMAKKLWAQAKDRQPFVLKAKAEGLFMEMMDLQHQKLFVRVLRNSTMELVRRCLY